MGEENKKTQDLVTTVKLSQDHIIKIIEKLACSPDCNISTLEKILELQQDIESKEEKRSFFRSS